MSEALFLINPKRKRNKNPKRKGRMPAGLRRYWAAHRRKTNPSRKHRRRARAINPVRRKRYSRSVPIARRRYAVRRAKHGKHRVVRTNHRRVSPFSVRGLKHTLMPAAIGATGAVALDVVYAYASPYLPHTLQTGWFALATKLAGAIGLGFGARKLLGRERGNAVALGALTVVGYGAIKPLIAQFAPTVKGLSGYVDYVDYGVGRKPPGIGFYSPASVMQDGPGMGAYLPGTGSAGMGAYMGTRAGLNGLGDPGQPASDYNWQADGM